MSGTDAGAVVSRFITCLAALDVPGMAACLSDDVVLELPAAPEGMPREVVGLAAFRGFFEPVAALWDRFELNDLAVHPSATEPGTVFLEYDSDASNDRGMAYANTYLSKATVREGRIVRYREMFDAAAASRLVAQLTHRA